MDTTEKVAEPSRVVLITFIAKLLIKQILTDNRYKVAVNCVMDGTRPYDNLKI